MVIICRINNGCGRMRLSNLGVDILPYQKYKTKLNGDNM